VRLVRAPLAFAAVLVTSTALAPAAAAGPAEDYTAVANDYKGDQDVTACRFTQQQLENARSQIPPDVDAYAPGFRTEINKEITRWKTGGCAGGGGGGGGSTVDLRIVKVRYKGKESVTIKNVGPAKVNLRKYTLRDRSGHKLRFKKTRLKAGRKLRVFTGCRKGHKKAFRKGARYYACKKTELWDDGGDVVKLFTPGGSKLSQRGYKAFSTVPKF
jgi:lamin tail-like protein